MNEEIKRVLNLLEKGKINKKEAAELIDALKEENYEDEPVSGSKDTSKKRFLRISAVENGKRIVNLTLPLSLINFGLRTFKATGKKTITVEGQEIPLDIDEINKAINDPDFRGKIIDIDEPEENTHVEIEIT
jgi:hypothetical protein